MSDIDGLGDIEPGVFFVERGGVTGVPPEELTKILDAGVMIGIAPEENYGGEDGR